MSCTGKIDCEFRLGVFGIRTRIDITAEFACDLIAFKKAYTASGNAFGIRASVEAVEQKGKFLVGNDFTLVFDGDKISFLILGNTHVYSAAVSVLDRIFHQL